MITSMICESVNLLRGKPALEQRDEQRCSSNKTHTFGFCPRLSNSRSHPQKKSVLHCNFPNND